MRLKFSVFGFVLLMPLAVAIFCFLYGEVSHSKKKSEMAEQARWLSRYLHLSKNDYQRAEEMLRADPPAIGFEFLKDWESVSISDRNGRIAIARHKRTLSGRRVIVWDDLSFEWKNDSDFVSSMPP
jgi:hypothetical protein